MYCVVCAGEERSFDSEDEAMEWATDQSQPWEVFDDRTGYCVQSSEDLEIFEKLEPFL